MKYFSFLLVLFLSFQSHEANCQTEYFEIGLRVSNGEPWFKYSSYKLYRKADTCVLDITTGKIQDMNNENFIEEQLHPADTTVIISMKNFNDLYRMTLAIDIETLLEGMNLQNPYIFMNEPYYELQYGYLGNYITINIFNPLFKTKERNLEEFVRICDEIINLKIGEK